MRLSLNNNFFFLCYLIFFILGNVVLLIEDKGQEILYINSFHNPIADTFFYYSDILGNGLFYIAVAILLAWKKIKYAILAIICFAVTGIFVQFLKNIVFPSVMRPKILLAHYDLHFVEGVKILSKFSFPSGHTATAFSMFFLLSIIYNKKSVGLLCCLLALIAGFSRMYLLQHFLLDVMAGSIIGLAITYFIVSKINFLNQPFFQKSLKDVF